MRCRKICVWCKKISEFQKIHCILKGFCIFECKNNLKNRLRRAKIKKKQQNLILELDFLTKIAPEGGENFGCLEKKH